MSKKLALLMVLIISLVSVSALSYFVQPVKALYQVTEIDINADGSVTPLDAPIENVNNAFYTLTGDVNITGPAGNPYYSAGINIKRSNVIFNGNGHTLMSGWGGGNGFVVYDGVNYVTIANSTAIGFNIALYLESDYNIITGNNFSGVGINDCVRLQAAGNNHFEGNNITNIGGSCVNMAYGGPNNIFVENYIVNSGAAIAWSSGGGGATFYHNTIGGGILGPYPPACIWDNGYPSGGNYWIGLTGTDKFSGPGQNITGRDGIIDTPHVIDSDDVDHYPFMMLDILNVSQSPPGDNVLSTDIVQVNATVTHHLPLEHMILNCTFTYGTAKWADPINMTNLEDDIWSGTIPASQVGTNVTYVIIAQDNAGTSINSASLGYTFAYSVVIPEFSAIMLLPILFVSILIAALFKRKRKHDSTLPNISGAR